MNPDREASGGFGLRFEGGLAMAENGGQRERVGGNGGTTVNEGERPSTSGAGN